MKTSPENGSATSRENPKHWIGVTVEDIPQGWMDDMVKRLFEILNRDMIRLESAQKVESDKPGPDGKPPPVDLEHMAKKERLLTQMQHSLERLTEMESSRVPARKLIRRKKAAIKHDDSLEELERRIARLVTAGGAAKGPSGSQPS